MVSSMKQKWLWGTVTLRPICDRSHTVPVSLHLAMVFLIVWTVVNTPSWVMIHLISVTVLLLDKSTGKSVVSGSRLEALLPNAVIVHMHSS